MIMENDEDFFKKIYINAGEIDQDILSLEKIQLDLRTKEGKEWVAKLNHLYSLYNKSVGEKIYKMI